MQKVCGHSIWNVALCALNPSAVGKGVQSILLATLCLLSGCKKPVEGLYGLRLGEPLSIVAKVVFTNSCCGSDYYFCPVEKPPVPIPNIVTRNGESSMSYTVEVDAQNNICALTVNGIIGDPKEVKFEESLYEEFGNAVRLKYGDENAHISKKDGECLFWIRGDNVLMYGRNKQEWVDKKCETFFAGCMSYRVLAANMCSSLFSAVEKKQMKKEAARKKLDEFLEDYDWSALTDEADRLWSEQFKERSYL